ncbi:MAG: ABC transporter ATP-binding protein [Egibacteraceae bacterium]
MQAARRAPGWSTVLVLATVAGAVAGLLFPAALGAAVDAVLGRAEPGPALTRFAAVLAATVLSGLLGGAAAAFYGASTIAWLRHRLLNQVLALGMAGQRRFAAGDVLARLGGDAPSSAQVLPALVGTAVAVATSVGAVVALWLIDWRVAAVLVIGLPVAVVFVRLFVVQALDLFVAYRRLAAAIAARLVDAFAGMRTIRASGTAQREIERILAPLAALSATGHALWRAQRDVVWQVGLLQQLLEIVVLSVAGFGLAAGRITPGELLAAVSYVRIALGIIEQIDTLIGVADARTGAARVAEVLAERPELSVVPTRPLPDGPGALTLRGVTVRGGESVLLDRLDLEVPGGVCLALVGRSGAGKTTLASLVGRLVDPDEGEVLLDGVPVAALAPIQLRRAVAYAFEQPALLGETVHDMIAYARPAASRAEVEHAARAAQADDFIRRLPEGYDTPLAQTPLSGGEAQRLGLARAVAQGGRVVVLDDATSSLDTATEVQVQAALAALLVGRTCIVVAHRATTAARADLVAWLDGGRVRALQPHVLLWEDSEYRAVFAASPVPAGAGAQGGQGS